MVATQPKGTVFFVDDEPQVLRALWRDFTLYTRFEDIASLQVGSAEECLELLEEQHQDVLAVVTDLRMPGMQGNELLSRISKRYPEIGLMLVTAYSDIDAIQDAIASSISSFVLKPWKPAQLVQEIDKTLETVTAKRNSRRYLREIEQQLKAAGEFQRRLLKIPNLENAGIAVDVAYRPVEGLYCSGDYYDVIPLGEDRHLLLLGDVSGHGVKPAFITGILKLLSGRIAREQSEASYSPAQFLEALSRAMFVELHNYSDVLISLAAVLIDTKSEEVVIASAGHSPVCTIRDEQCELWSPHGTAMGFNVLSELEEIRLSISPGDHVVMFTDGLWDVAGGDVTPKPFLRSVFSRAARSADFLKTVDRLLTAVSIVHGTGHAPVFRDDVTIFSARIL
ncbi:MAG: fused response regulator/phosphatase [Spirochaetales bacterium]|nr:fused response regulator/phosphatase [Spirochaetales bacterium]